MGNKYLAYPATVKALAEEIKIVCNDYYERKINNDKVRDVINWYAANQTDKFFVDGKLNPTVTKIIGKKRVQLITTLLEESRG